MRALLFQTSPVSILLNVYLTTLINWRHSFITPFVLVREQCEIFKLELIFETGDLVCDTQQHGQLKCPNLVFPFARTPVRVVPIKRGRTLVAKDKSAKRVLELTLDIEAHGDLQDFQPGDTIGILPKNPMGDVEQLLTAMQISNDVNRICRIKSIATEKKPIKVPLHIPSAQTSPLELLRDCLNLRAVLKKAFLRSLAECCSETADRQLLTELSSKEGTARYNELILEKGTTITDLLLLCPSCKPQLSLLVEHLPRLLPRPYSIANSPLGGSNELCLIFSIRNDKPGITTQMLDNLINAAAEYTTSSLTLLLYLRESNKFRYTTEQAYASNQLLIAIGTGVAPFLGFLQHKEHLKQTAPNAGRLGETWLFIGATNENSLPERSQLLALNAAGILNQYYESFSRSSNETQHRYVQDQMHQHAKELAEFLIRPATILYVCADGAEISRSIQTAVLECLQEGLAKTADEATDMLQEYRKCGKYREDVWA